MNKFVQYIERVNDIGYRFGAEGFFNGLPHPKCDNVVTIDCFYSNLCECHYVWQSNSMKWTFIGNLIEMIKQDFIHVKTNLLSWQMKSNDFRAFIDRPVRSVAR